MRACPSCHVAINDDDYTCPNCGQDTMSKAALVGTVLILTGRLIFSLVLIVMIVGFLVFVFWAC